MALALALLIALHAGAILWRGRGLRIRWGRGGSRSRALVGWAAGTALTFGVPAGIGLALLGVMPPWRDLPDAFAPLVVAIADAGLLLAPASLWLGMAAGTVVNIAITAWRASRGRAPLQIGHFPDIRLTSAREAAAGALLAVSAGVAEELWFRLFVPLTIALATGSALAGVAVATLLFGAMHRYQGWAGVIATTLAGAVLAFVYLASLSLWPAIALHVVVDLNALVIRGWVSSSVASRCGRSTR